MPIMKSFAAIQSSSFDDKFCENYSKFKHGSKTQARSFGKMFTPFCNFTENETLIIYSAPYNNIHTASNSFKDYLLSSLTDQILSKKLTVKQSRIHRKYSYDNDYGNMSKEERKNAISSDIFTIDQSIINPDDTLVFVDDIKITGSHEERIKELLVRENIKNNVIFLYIAMYTGDDPTIENRLNHFSVSNLKDINNIIRNEEFIFNTRVVKYILKADIEEFVSFITYQSETFKETLFNLSVLNGYHDNIKYSRNFNILKDLTI